MGATVYDCGAVSEGAHVYAHSRKDGKDGVAYLIVNNSNETTTVELPALEAVKAPGTLEIPATNCAFIVL